MFNGLKEIARCEEQVDKAREALVEAEARLEAVSYAFPPYVALGSPPSSAVRLQSRLSPIKARYYRPAGNWDMEVTVKEDGLYGVINGPGKQKVMVTPCSEEFFVEDNAGYL